MRTLTFVTCILALSLFSVVGVSAQTTLAPVPDVTNLPLPLAAARLNEAGLALGGESVRLWSAALGVPNGTVVGQAVAPGTAVEAGSTVDLTVLRAPNLAAIYDDNELTLLNQSSSPISLATLGFASLDGASASFAASRWAASQLDPGGCVQVWAVPVNSPKPMDGCREMQYWLTTNNPAEHFWTGQGGATQFSILENGALRAVCAVSTTGRCELYVGGGAVMDAGTEFVHFAYTEHWFVVRNTSDDLWMHLDGFMLFNYNTPQPGLGVPLGDPALYATRSPLGSTGRLAPGQCLLFHSQPIDAISADLPQCFVMGALQTDPSVRFWGAAFEMNSMSDGQRRACPAATPERVTVCIMPR